MASTLTADEMRDLMHWMIGQRTQEGAHYYATNADTAERTDEIKRP
jgi:hypothetical protein